MANDAREDLANRPYRRFVGLLFALAVTGICVLLLRGIVGRLDRLPSASTLDRPAAVDRRALLACAEDLERLEADTRRQAGKAFAQSLADEPTWPEVAKTLELERLRLVARCHLDAAVPGPQEELGRAAEAIEGLLRSYTLLHARLTEDGLQRGAEARQAIEAARNGLK